MKFFVDGHRHLLLFPGIAYELKVRVVVAAAGERNTMNSHEVRLAVETAGGGDKTIT